MESAFDKLATDVAVRARSADGGGFVIERVLVDRAELRPREVSLSSDSIESRINVAEGRLGSAAAALAFDRAEIPFAESAEFEVRAGRRAY